MFIQNIDPIIFQYGPLQLRWYSLLFVGSILLAFEIAKYIVKKEQIKVNLDDLILPMLFGIIIGARVFHCLFYEPEYYLKHPLEILYIWKGGLASHGGIIGAIIVLYWFSKKYNIDFWWAFSRGAFVALLVDSAIRIGNFINSEILGLPTNSNFGVIFQKVDTIPRHPVQLYEAISYFILFIIIAILYKKLPSNTFTRIAAPLIIGIGFLIRFILEYFKTPQTEFANILPFSMGQILSLPFIVFSIWLFFYLKRKYR
jgi:prolipoprotein diacylglyceryl transferase